MPNERLLIKVTRETLPKIRDRYPFVYLEHGRLEVDDSSVKWIDSDNRVIPLPIATIQMLLFGPGTSVTHEAIKVLSSVNCMAAWVGADSLLFYSFGLTPTADSRNLRKQVELSVSPEKRLQVAKRMFAGRFPDADTKDATLKDLMGMEGKRVKLFYIEKAEQYQVGWTGRAYTPGNFTLSDITNKILTACNTALYGIVNSCILSLGFSPRIGFVHSGSPLPFTYDVADLYKAEVSIDLAFKLTRELGGHYLRETVRDAFVRRVIDAKLLARIPEDIFRVLGMKNDRSHSE